MNPWRLMMRRRRPEADFSEEIRAHLVLEADRLVAEGFTPHDAALEARRRFGNVGQAQEAYHLRREIPWFEGAARHVRRAARRLRHAPVFSLTVVLTLALGIGSTTAVFSLIHAVLLRPLPYQRPGQLVELSHSLEIHGASRVDQSDATYLHYRAANHVFSGVGAWRTTAVNLGPEDAEHVMAARASASLFALLHLAPLRGRVFDEREDVPGGPRVAVIGEPLWRRRFGGDPGVVGRSITVDGLPYDVIGVMPERFAFPVEQVALWLPIQLDAAHTQSATFDVHAVARLRDGVTMAAALADLGQLLPHVPEVFPGRLTAAAIEQIHMQPVLRPWRDTVVGAIGPALWVVFGAAALLLLIACANVANLFLVRAESRQHDLAVRLALGAGRRAIAAEFLAEGLILAGLGGALGLALAAAGIGALRAMQAGIAIPRLGGAGVNGTVLAVAATVTVVAALIMSLVPALRSGGAGLSAVLVATGRGATAGRERHLARRAFVVVQVALALVLVAGAGLMVRSFARLRAVEPGFDPRQAWAFRLALPAGTWPTTGDAAGLVVRALDAIAALPGVEAAGAISKLPLDDEGRRDTALWVEDRPLGMGAMPDLHQVVYAAPGTFAALGVPLIQGRDFERPDASRAPLEVVVTRAVARKYWGAASAVGRRVRFSVPAGAWFTIVGVTGDVRGTRLEDAPDETVFLPLVTAPGPAAADGGAGPGRFSPRELAIVVRGSGQAGLVAPVERTLRAMAPSAPVYGARSLAEVVARAGARTTFTLRLLGLASLAALLIGAVGLYGVMSYMVSLRAREMAVRIALGARPAALRRLVLGQAAAVAGIGIVLGVGAAVPLMRFLTTLLFGVKPTDPAALLGSAALMAGVAMAAGWLPARRASAMDPATALRTDA